MKDLEIITTKALNTSDFSIENGIVSINATNVQGTGSGTDNLTFDSTQFNVTLSGNKKEISLKDGITSSSSTEPKVLYNSSTFNAVEIKKVNGNIIKKNADSFIYNDHYGRNSDYSSLVEEGQSKILLTNKLPPYEFNRDHFNVSPETGYIFISLKPGEAEDESRLYDAGIAGYNSYDKVKWNTTVSNPKKIMIDEKCFMATSWTKEELVSERQPDSPLRNLTDLRFYPLIQPSFHQKLGINFFDENAFCYKKDNTEVASPLVWKEEKDAMKHKNPSFNFWNFNELASKVYYNEATEEEFNEYLRILHGYRITIRDDVTIVSKDDLVPIYNSSGELLCYGIRPEYGELKTTSNEGNAKTNNVYGELFGVEADKRQELNYNEIYQKTIEPKD